MATDMGPGGGGKKSGLAANYFYGGSYGGSGRLGEGLTDGASLVGLPRFYFLATNTYGSAEAPLDPGSGGNGPNLTTSGYMGGSGGGAVRIIADQIVVNGLISANGTVPVGSSHGSGGSGGGIYITCSTITGTNGTLSANGAQGQASGGGAGGGRIAVAYEPVAQGALPVPSVRFSAAPGKSGGGNTTLSGDIGTLWFPDAYFFSPTNLFTGQWMAPAPSELALDGWTVSNVWVRLPGINLTVTNALTIAGTDNERYKLEFTNAATIQCGQLRLSGASLTLGGVTTERSPTYRNPFPADVAGPTLTCAGDLIMTNAARFHVYAGLTNAGAPPWCGVRVEVGNDLLIATNCWVYPVSHPTNGASPLFTMRNLTVGCGGGFNADCFGCAGGIGDSLAYGEGAPTEKSHGAGYGGTGGVGYRSGSPGLPYGSAAAPTAPGSGAKSPPSLNNYGPYGGGSVQIRAEKKVNFYGVITANGGKGQSNYGGGASGGGIYITCHSFIGNSNALLQANGGGGQNYGGTALYGGGGGSGGRIAVWRVRDFSASAVSNSVSGGLGGIPNNGLTNAAPGTFIMDWLPAEGTLIQLR
ncbi:MAG: hypothetical protein PHV28_05815 [Kiritimatiellae bacterium]|nr:hypothetical protein [Kiritimatiellia bacterium]